MDELLGLCSGRFSDGEDKEVATRKTGDNKKQPKDFCVLKMGGTTQESNMDELLGLCSGRFTAVDSNNDGDDNDGDEDKKTGTTGSFSSVVLTKKTAEHEEDPTSVDEEDKESVDGENDSDTGRGVEDAVEDGSEREDDEIDHKEFKRKYAKTYEKESR